MNALHYAKRVSLGIVVNSWSNDTTERIPFSCDSNLDDTTVKNRIFVAVKKKHPSSHFGGGYSCDMTKFVRETPTSGYVELFHYQGIGGSWAPQRRMS